jgi:DNA-binding CsgD family transcriptional regulator/PAS domain-containing protein
MANEAAYDLIVGAFYDAALEPLRLRPAVAEIVDAVHATGVHLHGIQKSSGEIVLSALSGLSATSEVDYIKRYSKIDPRMPPVLAARVGHWISCHEHITPAFVETNEFYQDYLIPYGARYLSAAKVFETEQYAAVLSVHTGPREQPLAENALSFLRRLTPHVSRALGLIFEYSRLSTQWTVVKATLDSLDHAAFVCDEKGQILVNNEAADALLQQSDGLSRESGSIWIQHQAARQRFLSLLRNEGPGNANRANQSLGKGTLLIPRPSQFSPYLMTLRLVERAQTLFNSEQAVLWSVTVSDPVSSSAQTLRALAMRYHLTPAEAKLATYLAAGAMPGEVALQTGVRITTIRSQLSSLFAKTGTRRQSELMRLLSSLPALR